MPFSLSAESFIDGDASEPSSERRVAPEAGKMPERADIRLLNDIFGLAVIAKNAARRAVELPVIALHEVAVASVFSPAGEDNQLFIAKPARFKGLHGKGIGHIHSNQYDPQSPA
jgi:hypothetical protein